MHACMHGMGKPQKVAALIKHITKAIFNKFFNIILTKQRIFTGLKRRTFYSFREPLETIKRGGVLREISPLVLQNSFNSGKCL